MNIEQILERLPHRYPFVLVDRILEAREGFVKALKNVTINEPFFVGHFPTKPIMPGVLIIEAMAQASVFLLETAPGQIAFLAGVENARFKRPVIPGDQLILQSELIYFRRGLGRAKVQASVDEIIAAEAEILFALQN